jgi:hypothetical protein
MKGFIHLCLCGCFAFSSVGMRGESWYLRQSILMGDAMGLFNCCVDDNELREISVCASFDYRLFVDCRQLRAIAKLKELGYRGFLTGLSIFEDSYPDGMDSSYHSGERRGITVKDLALIRNNFVGQRQRALEIANDSQYDKKRREIAACLDTIMKETIARWPGYWQLRR